MPTRLQCSVRYLSILVDSSPTPRKEGDLKEDKTEAEVMLEMLTRLRSFTRFLSIFVVSSPTPRKEGDLGEIKHEAEEKLEELTRLECSARFFEFWVSRCLWCSYFSVFFLCICFPVFLIYQLLYFFNIL